MLDDEFIRSLPQDPRLAFALLEARLREAFAGLSPNQHPQKYESAQEQYIEYIAAFVDLNNIDLGEDINFDPNEEDFDVYFLKLKYLAGKAAKRFKLEDIAPENWRAFGVFRLAPTEKEKIRKHIENIRILIAAAKISDQKRDALINRLNAFAAEIDRDRTRLDALTSFYIFAKRELDEQATAQIERIFLILQRAKELIGLSGPSEQKRLPPPKSGE